jgi:YVTN family beta-propeller protein
LRGIAFLPDGSRAYVAGDQQSELVVIDVARHAVLNRVRTASSPFGVTPHPDGKRVFVSAPGAGKVQVLDTSADRIVAEFDACKGSSSMALTPDGHKLYVACGPANQVLIFEASSYKRLAQLTVGVTPVSIVIREPNPPAGGSDFEPRRGKPKPS